MASATGTAGLSIEIIRVFTARRQRVWEAWTQPEQLARWMCRTNPEAEVRIVHMDLRAGGRLALEAQSPKGPLYQLDCEYREISALEKLVFTWKWRGEEEETLVTVEFRDHAPSGGTELRLRHGKFTGEKSRDGHNFGWNACLDVLAGLLK